MEHLEVADIAFAGSTMEHLVFTDSDPSSVSAFLAGGLQADTARSAHVEVAPAITGSVLPSSPLVLADDQTALGANLQIGLDLAPIANTTGSMFYPGSEPFTSLANSAGGIIEETVSFSNILNTQPPPSSVQQVAAASVQNVPGGNEQIQSIASIADMNMALHNYAGPLDAIREVPAATPARNSLAGLAPVERSGPSERIDIKGVEQTSAPDMLLVYDKSSGKNLLLPIAATSSTTASSFNQSDQQKDLSSLGTITINVGDFLNILNQAGKKVLPVTQTAVVPNPKPDEQLFNVPFAPEFQKTGAASSQWPVERKAHLDQSLSMLPLPNTTVHSNDLPNKVPSLVQSLTPLALLTDATPVSQAVQNSSQSLDTKLASFAETVGDVIQTPHNIVSSGVVAATIGDLPPVHTTDLCGRPATENDIAHLASTLNTDDVHVPAGKQEPTSLNTKPPRKSEMFVNIQSDRLGRKRIRKPTPKQEQLQEEKIAKENAESSPPKSKRGRRPKIKTDDGQSPNKDQNPYSAVAASKVARMIDTVGQSAFMEKLDVSVHVDESQCIVLDGQKRWKCLLCPKVYSSKHNLITHILDHSGIKPHCCMICGKHFKQASHLQTHMLTHGNLKPHSCTICQRSFSQASHVKRHMAIHMERKPHMCTVCSRGFAFPSELKAHMEKHENGKENACDECDTAFDSLKKLRAHKAIEHASGDLTCSECGKQYTYPSQLRDHMMKHEGKRPYICGECGMDFMKEHHLKAHQFTHTGLKPFVCTECGRGFNQKANLQRHLLIHDEEPKFKCDMCDRSFTQPQTLKSHMMTHDSKKPHKCKVCEKEFSRLHNLNGHMHMHNGEKPHLCHICGASFTLKGNLNRHKKDKHNLDGNTECTEEEAAKILNEMSGKKLVESDTQEVCGDESPAPKKKRKSFPRKTVTEEGGSEVDMEIEAAWQKEGLSGESAQEYDADGSPQDLLNQILSGNIPGMVEPPDTEGVKTGGQEDGRSPEVQTVTRVENPDGSTEWIAYIPLTGQEGLQPGATHEVSITLVPTAGQPEGIESKPDERSTTDSQVAESGVKQAVNISGRGRKRKPINYGSDFVMPDTVVSAPPQEGNKPGDTGEGKKPKRSRCKTDTDSSAAPLVDGVSKHFIENTAAGPLGKGKPVVNGRGKKASLASVLATKLGTSK